MFPRTNIIHYLLFITGHIAFFSGVWLVMIEDLSPFARKKAGRDGIWAGSHDAYMKTAEECL